MSRLMKARDRAKELENSLGGWSISIEYEVDNSGAWCGVGYQTKSFSAAEIETAREFARNHECISATTYDPAGRWGPKYQKEFWRMIHELDDLKKVTA